MLVNGKKTKTVHAKSPSTMNGRSQLLSVVPISAPFPLHDLPLHFRELSSPRLVQSASWRRPIREPSPMVSGRCVVFGDTVRTFG